MRVLTVAVEKQQVSILADRVNDVLDQLAPASAAEPGTPGGLPEDTEPLQTPFDEDWRVQTLSLAWDEDRQVLVIECHDHDPDEVVDDAPADEAAVLGPQLHARQPHPRGRPGVRTAHQRPGRGGSPAVPLLRWAARPDRPHLPARQWLQALRRSAPDPPDLTGELEVTRAGRRLLQPRRPGPSRRRAGRPARPVRHLQARSRRAAAVGLPRRHPRRAGGRGARGVRARWVARRSAHRPARRAARARVGAAVDRRPLRARTRRPRGRPRAGRRRAEGLARRLRRRDPERVGRHGRALGGRRRALALGVWMP